MNSEQLKKKTLKLTLYPVLRYIIARTVHIFSSPKNKITQDHVHIYYIKHCSAWRGR